ncbi:MAG: HNH endonuclease, partial [Neisseriaceae bacterium]
MEKIKYFNHIRFTLDNQSGYYLSARKINGKQIRMHRYIWEFFNGIIPDGFCIHHIDHD